MRYAALRNGGSGCRLNISRDDGTPRGAWRLRREEQSAGCFQEADHVVQESCGGGAVNQPMVVGKAQRHHETHGYLVVHDDRHLTRTANEQDGCLRNVDNRRRVRAANGSQVADRERGSSQIFNREAAGADFFCRVGQLCVRSPISTACRRRGGLAQPIRDPYRRQFRCLRSSCK